jgi:16S rRNA C967 or C1407 C5-methylase (RsmB/RsmF family)/NOL1/NOP2/fmu family ribosome biogenesis protein
MNIPQDLLSSLKGVAGFNEEAFVAVHENVEEVTSIRVNPAKSSLEQMPFAVSSPVPWAESGYYLSQRPSFTFDPLFHAGCYYVQEASSMFLEQALKQLLDLSEPLKVLDLCAAPGGKSTHIQSLISTDSLLVSNEVIKQRSYVLSDNIIKWGSSNVFVTNNDPKAFQKLPAYFDAMIVDAPCSGSGLFRKDEEAVQEWSLNNVALCSQRQQRILADALPALKEGGVLIYSTCSYSKEEDEAIADWLLEEMEMESLSLTIENFTGIVKTISPQNGAAGYRFYPDKIRGEGFFLACFRKRKTEAAGKLRPSRPELISSKEKRLVSEWVESDSLEYIRFRDSIFAVPQKFFNDFCNLQPVLNLQYAGVQIGEVMKERLVPHHALAQSVVVQKAIPFTELSYDNAIKYLQRAELSIQPEKTGWQAVRYKGHNLGWVNALKNRVNNYYPKEIRILKQHNNTAFEK